MRRWTTFLFRGWGHRPAAVGPAGERGERAVDGIGDSVERFRPDHHADTLPEVSLDLLAAAGMRGIIVDLDNTVCAYHRPSSRPAWRTGSPRRARAASRSCSSRTTSASASRRSARGSGIPVVPNALKPLPFAFLRALRLLGTPRGATIVIGDQLFTDVLGAKLLGLRTILTKPLVEHDFPLTRVLRFLERTHRRTHLTMALAAVVFDLYGTLLDDRVDGCARRRGGHRGRRRVRRRWRRKQLEYAFLTSMAHAYRDFDELTALALDSHVRAARRRARRRRARGRSTRAWRTMPAYADVAPALRALRARGSRCAVLTNGTPSARTRLSTPRACATCSTTCCPSQTVRAYKPDPRVYALATAALRLRARARSSSSPRTRGTRGARARFGFRVAWCNRAGTPREALDPAPEATLRRPGRAGGVRGGPRLRVLVRWGCMRTSG